MQLSFHRQPFLHVSAWMMGMHVHYDYDKKWWCCATWWPFSSKYTVHIHVGWPRQAACTVYMYIFDIGHHFLVNWHHMTILRARRGHMSFFWRRLLPKHWFQIDLQRKAGAPLLGLATCKSLKYHFCNTCMLFLLIHCIISMTCLCFSSYLRKHNRQIFSCFVPKQVLEFSKWLHAYQWNNKVSFGLSLCLFIMLSNAAQKVEFTMNNQTTVNEWIKKFKAENLFWY